MKREVTVMNYLEVMGSIAHLLDSDYKEFFETYKELDEEVRDDFVAGTTRQGEISNFRVLSDDIIDFLGLPDNQHWYISTFDAEYLKKI